MIYRGATCTNKFLFMNASNPYLRVFESPIVFFFSSLCFPESKNDPSITNVVEKRRRGKISHDAQNTARKKTTQKKRQLSGGNNTETTTCTVPKIRTSIPRNENARPCSQFLQSLYLGAIYIFPGSVCLFGCRKIGRPILGIYKSIKDI